MENEVKNSIQFLNKYVGKEHGFSVPKNYFNNVETDLENKFLEESLPNSNGFSIPANYFNNLETEILGKVSELTIPKEEKLNDIPDGYFDSLEDAIFEKLKKAEEPNKEVKVISFYQRVQKIIPVAAAAVIILFIGTYFFNGTTASEIEFEETDIVSWFENGYGEANSYELAILFTQEELEEEEFTVNLSNDNIEEYFNTIDTSNLIEFEEEE
ncbi:hypothetical protein BTO06_04905 [Tenacibaculum sp. SZ-18]|uniref:hypothetical protein n=1 Tax=Tenacibaculum sp. SZ-18 TaxID=754423 RepID=UPI000C2D5A74|nr:hypothetical protein [Tenacibaculum sp. SZ-18]AUC14523.1 hypothetical protein BTO06_04905 [Tenacibaculum sp. SZ-18]